MKRRITGIVAAGLVLGMFAATPQVFANTQNNVKVNFNTVSSAPSIKAEVQGQSYPAIVVHGDTYVLWGALQLFDTPYVYEGNGVFNVAGHEVEGVIYKGQTYLKWTDLAFPDVLANKIIGGWNFTRDWDDTSTDGYKLLVTISQPQIRPGSMTPIWIQTFDSNDKPIANQNVTAVELPVVPSDGTGSFDLQTNKTGTTYMELYGLELGNNRLQVTWTDPKGVKHEIDTGVMVQNPASTQTPTPSDDTTVATIPVTIIDDQVLFSGQVNGQDINWQLDTGAMTPLINAADAKKLNLPDLQDISVQGVTGSSKAYISKINVTLGGVTFNDVLVIVDPSFQGTSLFGYSFFNDNAYDLLVSFKHNTITVLK